MTDFSRTHLTDGALLIHTHTDQHRNDAAQLAQTASSTGVSSGRCAHSVVPEPVNEHTSECANASAPGRANGHTGECANASATQPFEFTCDHAERDLIRQVQELRGPNGTNDLADIFFEALSLLKAKLERQRRVKAERAPRRRRPDAPHVAAAIRREVWKRDGHQCAFIGITGHRCDARRGLECDHVVPVERGGASTVSNVWLLCRTHRRFEAERTRGFTETTCDEAAPIPAPGPAPRRRPRSHRS